MTVEFDSSIYAGWIFKPRKGMTQIFIPVEIGETDVSGWIVSFSPRPDDSGWSSMELRPATISERELTLYELMSWNRVADTLNANFGEFERQVRSKFHGGTLHSPAYMRVDAESQPREGEGQVDDACPVDCDPEMLDSFTEADQ